MLISQALAATEATGEAAHEAFYQDPTFFVALAFITFFVVLGKKLFGAINAMLDNRAQKISDEIEQATRLREEAQELLASYEKKQHEALKEAEAIVAAAKDEATRLAAEAAEQLDHSLKRAEQLAKDRIAQAETQAIAQVKSQAVNLAMDAAQRILESDVTGKKADALIDDAIKALDGKLH
ncbi:MAG TPA: F0F1 ATP synthase subunit B [Magnetovibrio sp.]